MWENTNVDNGRSVHLECGWRSLGEEDSTPDDAVEVVVLGHACVELQDNLVLVEEAGGLYGRIRMWFFVRCS